MHLRVDEEELARGVEVQRRLAGPARGHRQDRFAPPDQIHSSELTLGG
jgi:hypothetical protein